MKQKILMIDDDIDLLQIYSQFLQKSGYEVEVAYNGAEGVEKFKEYQPDAVFVDLAMEHFDSGFKVCHQIKALPEGKKVPVIIMTSAGHETGIRFSTETAEERRWISADDYLEKPIPLKDFLGYLQDKVFKTKHS